jgi:hypothetical protein
MKKIVKVNTSRGAQYLKQSETRLINGILKDGLKIFSVQLVEVTDKEFKSRFGDL